MVKAAPALVCARLVACLIGLAVGTGAYRCAADEPFSADQKSSATSAAGRKPAGDGPAAEIGRDSSVPPVVATLIIEPNAIVLHGGNRRQQILVTGQTVDGRLIDLTDRAEVSVQDARVARSTGSLVFGVADGETLLEIQAGGLRHTLPVRVAGFERAPAVHFGNDLVPLFTKLGCNSGGCHGKATGQNGFKLSVFGFDPPGDYAALVHEARGRRLFPSDPERSLLLQKATGRTPHGGGRRMEPDSPDEALLLDWIRQAMPLGSEAAPRLVGLRVSPAERALPPASPQQILATAVYSDGSLRDVTAAAAYTSNAPLIADVAAPGLIRSGTVPGEAAITVNYMGQVAAVQIQRPRPPLANASLDLPIQNEIDRHVGAKLRKMGIAPSELAGDAMFLRRAFLDCLGRLPEVQDVREFLADTRNDRRGRLIDRLLERDEFADYWAVKFADLLLVDRDKLGDRGAFEFHRWLRNNFAQNRPYDEWVRELITATGDSARLGAVNFYRAQRSPEELARSVSQAFLGIRLDCAQCHHHPFERWGQDDFYGMAGFFNGLRWQKLPRDDQREFVYHAGYTETRMPLTGALVPTRAPGAEIVADFGHQDPRVRLAAWMTAPANPSFSRLVANRIWKQFLGRGLIEPEDDLRSTNPATNEPLLQYLAGVVVAEQFNLKALMRQVMQSRTYQLSSVPNETNADDEQNFSHYRLKRLPAEVLMDAISQVTGVAEEFPGMPQGTRALELWDNRFPSYFLEIFGRPERNTPCECGRSNEPTLAQTLHLMNAPEVESKVGDPRGRIAGLIRAGRSQAEIVNELCLAALGRLPDEKEQAVADQLFNGADRQQAAEDFLWALLNSYDFLFVH